MTVRMIDAETGDLAWQGSAEEMRRENAEDDAVLGAIGELENGASEVGVGLYRLERVVDDAVVEKIATEVLGFSLDVQNRDSLDFHDLHVATIKRALMRAYEAGVAASTSTPRG